MSESEAQDAAGTASDGAMAPQAAGRPVARFVHERPAMVIAGGLALGALAAALLPRRNRAFVAEKSSALADAVSAAGLTLYREALDRAEAAGDGVRGIAGRLGAPGAAKPDDADSPGETASRGPDLAGSLAALLRHLRGRSRD